MKKRGYEFGFSWIFAIIIGAVILFIAIYATTKVIDTDRTKIDTIRAKEIGILITPVETNLEQAKLATIIVPQPTRINNNCTLEGEFGEQEISALTSSGFGDEWQPVPGVTSTFHNKYIFSSGQLEAEENFFIFTKPFKFPFKIADLTMIWSDKENYCFFFSSNSGKQASIKKELTDLAPENVEIVTALGDCTQSDDVKTVCFSGSCDISISLQSKSVDKGGTVVRYVESLDRNDRFALLFAAVFSEPQNYNCQVERLTKRAANLAELYADKSRYLTPKGCSSSPVLPSALLSYKSAMLSVSSDLGTAEFQAEDLKNKNGRLSCRLF